MQTLLALQCLKSVMTLILQGPMRSDMTAEAASRRHFQIAIGSNLRAYVAWVKLVSMKAGSSASEARGQLHIHPGAAQSNGESLLVHTGACRCADAAALKQHRRSAAPRSAVLACMRSLISASMAWLA